MSSLPNYHRNGTHSRPYYPSLASIASTDSNPLYGTTRDMGPPLPVDFPPQPVEIDLNCSRTLPSPSTSGLNIWEPNLPHSGFVDGVYGSSSVTRMQQSPSDNQVRGPNQDPIAQWYSGNDGPWVPKVIPDAAVDERNQSRRSGNRSIVSYGTQYRQTNPSDAGSAQFAIPPSDSGYGTRRSIGNTSVFSADIPDRDQDCQSLAGHVESYQPFQGFNDVFQSRDSRSHDSWAIPTIPPGSASSSFTCLTCKKPVKTQSELKKHELRHTKPFKCDVQGCPRTQGFSTPNDLERHRKSKHSGVLGATTDTEYYRCNIQGCKSKDKHWPRLDNFRSHLRRVHPQCHDTEKRFKLLIKNRENVWERPSSDANQENHTPAQDSPLPAVSHVPEGAPKTTDREWTATYPDVAESPRNPATPKFPALDRSEKQTVPQESAIPWSEVPRHATVQPQEFPPPPARYSAKYTVASVLSPAYPSDAGLKTTYQVNKNQETELPTQGKAAGQSELSASDAALRKGLRTALSDRGVSALSNQDRGRNVLPNGRTSPSRPFPLNPGPGIPNHSQEGNTIKTADSPLSCPDEEHTAALRRAEEIVKSIRHLGFTLKEDPNLPPKLNAGSAAGNKSDKQRRCMICNRFKGRPCELKKHMKRHDRPYGCTFPSCGKSFGSKNDWKRHEGSQHFQIETWRCDTPQAGGGNCSKACFREVTFREHLEKDHQISDEDSVKDKLESCHIGRNSQERFWCGFCAKLIELQKRGVEAWTERFDHIDNHFMGRGTFRKQTISDWVPLDGSDKAKAQSGTSTFPGGDSISLSSASSTSGSTPITDISTTATAARHPGSPTKRPNAAEDEGSSSPKRVRYVGVEEETVDIVVCVSPTMPRSPYLTAGS
ncbi:hypothetical protein BJ875DRAFT_380381 [Amylocarpus encephaloides]|uniref:C2H2-type domain-containing protein n=1 Tax=Amylocarpus encephaloides TaxID=45428 RepID=A0A9P7YFA3_9HELO|nr:hypothetical protein BJ875DRAFT_380381 [Amylocarpus encephaloides]